MKIPNNAWQITKNVLYTPVIILAIPLIPLFLLVLLGGCALTTYIQGKIDPPGWRRWFALWPAECDPWPDEGEEGWFWMEWVYRNPSASGFTYYRKEAPKRVD